MYFVAIMQPWSLNMVDYGCFDGHKYFTLLNPYFLPYVLFSCLFTCSTNFYYEKRTHGEYYQQPLMRIDLPCVFQFIVCKCEFRISIGGDSHSHLNFPDVTGRHFALKFSPKIMVSDPFCWCRREEILAQYIKMLGWKRHVQNTTTASPTKIYRIGQ